MADQATVKEASASTTVKGSEQKASEPSSNAGAEPALVALTPEIQAAMEMIAAQKAALALQAEISEAITLLQANGFTVRGASQARTGSTRSTVEKADPDMVRDYFASTGLTPRELGDAVGVGLSVISTVQNVNGDRWSLERFNRAKILIDAAVAAKAAAATPKATVAGS